MFTAAFLAAATAHAEKPGGGMDPENTLYLELKDGRVVIEMLPDIAPGHVARIKELVRQGFYDGLAFHRVIAGDIAQTGAPKDDGRGGSGKSLKAEFSWRKKHLRGTASMARQATNFDSADSQFFICMRDMPSLDGLYTIWGHVVSGMDLVDRIKEGERDLNGKVLGEPDRIVSMKVAADVAE